MIEATVNSLSKRHFEHLAAALCAAALLGGCATSKTPAPVEERALGPRATPLIVAGPGTAPALPASDTSKPLPGAENAGKPGYYTVKPGDTMIRVGLESGQNWKDLVKWNNLENANVIEVGQVLRVVPPGENASGVSTRPITVSKAETRPLDAKPAPTAASDPSAALALLERKVDALAGALASLVPALTAAVGESVAERVAAATAEVTTDVTDRVTGRVTESVKRHLEALESSRAAEAAAAHAADRAAVEGALAGARKVASEAAVEVRRLESALRMIERQQEKATSDVRKLESGLAEVLAVLAPVSSGLSKLVVGLEDVSGTLPRDVARALEAPLVQRTAALERTLLRASEETASRLAGVDEHVTAMASALDKAVDEARQKKKTWFG